MNQLQIVSGDFDGMGVDEIAFYNPIKYSSGI